MGASGVKLFDDDLACNVRDDFHGQLQLGKTGDEATAILTKDYEDVLGTENEGVFWLALAAVQWQYGLLQPRLLERVLAIIESGSDLIRWKDDLKLLAARQKELARFATRLKSPNSSPKQIRRKTRGPVQFEWDRGDVFSYRLPSGEYLLFRVVAVERNDFQIHPTCELLDWIGTEIPNPNAIIQLPIRRNKRYASESSFSFPVLKKHLSRCRSLNLRLEPTMQGTGWILPLNFNSLSAELNEHFGMTVG